MKIRSSGRSTAFDTFIIEEMELNVLDFISFTPDQALWENGRKILKVYGVREEDKHAAKGPFQWLLHRACSG